MRYSSTVVLSTLAIGSAAAAHNRHASFHARREASKRDDVDWSNVAYDLKDVDWSAINWKSVFSEPTPAAKQEPAPVAATPTPEPKKESAPAPKPAAAAPSKESSHDGGLLDGVTDVVTDLLQGVAEISSQIGAKMGINDKSANNGLWIGGDGEFGMDVTNNGPDAMYVCWVKNGFSGMSVNVNAPAISVGIKSGQTVKISAAAGVSGACAPATGSTPKSNFGGVKNTWAEFTFSNPNSNPKVMGAFNVSKNVNMKGCSISMKGSTCTSDMSTCVFQCNGNVDSCVTGYELINCSASNGGGGGYDPIMQGTGGGCNMPDNAERIKVSFS